jgi:hypothetical protein
MPFRCPYCDHLPFQLFSGLRNHAREQHADRCAVCKRTYFNIYLHVIRNAKLRDRRHMIYYGLIAPVSASANAKLSARCQEAAMRTCRVPSPAAPVSQTKEAPQ